MGAIHVGIGHNNDLVVTRFGRVEGTVAFAVADACSDCSDEGSNFVVQYCRGGLFLHLATYPESEGWLGSLGRALALPNHPQSHPHNVEFGQGGILEEQSASLPGRPPEESAPLRTVSRALRAASRARAALRHLSMSRLATCGLVSK